MAEVAGHGSIIEAVYILKYGGENVVSCAMHGGLVGERRGSKL